MKRPALLATTVVGLAMVLATCSDTGTEPAAASKTLEAERAAFLRSPAGQVQFSCGFFAGTIAWRYGLTPEERDRITAACKRITEQLIPLIPLDREEICRVIMEDPAFDYLPQRIRDAISAFCSSSTGTP